MHDLGGAHDLTAVDLADALMAEADAEDRQPPRRRSTRSRRWRCPRSSGGPDPGDISRSARLRRRVGRGDRVIADDDRIGAELAEVLHEVVDEAVVVVDDDDARAH